MSTKEIILEILKDAKKVSLTNTKSGDSILLIATKKEWNDVIVVKHKEGYISTKIYNNNIETFNLLDTLKENVTYFKNEADTRKETIIDYTDMLNKIKNDSFYQRAYAQRKQMYVDGLEMAQKELPQCQSRYKKELALLRETQQKVKNIIEESINQMKI